ncbi:hypothetical protein [Bradyrhizobium sp. AUGA SZCCT0182]|uniref:hypothetical protein n=1 Tax=Bradyrhizobium sp. AUGA SZCCT0182 TaxID=2807667 RepID=UPI001BA55471|nr:hypothetical protein [Bradyrhizobium sp. AUGA SZCCT0182]MBR1232014.1 hypothetical protein [Bradyrhizobium sp. AUGA SZCCT0182]
MSEFDKGIVQAMFSKHAKKNIDTYFPLIEAAYAEQTKDDKKLTDEDHQALKLYIYATIRAETGNFSPRKEGISRYNSYTLPEIEPVYDRKQQWIGVKSHDRIVNVSLLNRPYQRYEEGKQAKNLNNTEYGDGEKFKGRGFVQLTGRKNYKDYANVVPGLEADPDLAEKPENAAKLVVAYVLRNKAAILKDLSQGNMTHARIVVNGQPKKGKQPNGLHDFSSAYEKGKKQATALEPASKNSAGKLPANSTPAAGKPAIQNAVPRTR